MTARWFAFTVLSVLAISPITHAEVLPAGCDLPAELRRALPADYEVLEKLPYREHVTREHARLAELVASYPREVEPYRALVDLVRLEEEVVRPGTLAALQRTYKEKAAAHPDDLLAVYEAGYALLHTDTPEAIRLLERVRSGAPQFPWAAIDLSGVYRSEKFADKQKAAADAEVFWTACPASRDHMAELALGKDPTLQVQVAVALRARLEKATDPATLEEYQFLWRLEFRAHPAPEHDALRRQVALDVKRVETRNAKPDAAWAAFLIGGYKQSGASAEIVKAREDRLLKDFPHSDQAYEIVSARWKAEHREPVSQKDKSAWRAYQAAYEAAIRDWVHAYPGAIGYLGFNWAYVTSGDDQISEQDGVAMAETFAEDETQRPDGLGRRQAATFLLQHRWQPAKALAWLEEARDEMAKCRAAQPADDELKNPEDDFWARMYAAYEQGIPRDMLLAALRAKQPQAVAGLRARVEGAPPTDAEALPEYWMDRARLAQIDGRRQDAMAYYQLALGARTAPTEYFRGVLRDDLADEARELWKDLGGTETAWKAWSAQPPKTAVAAEPAHWVKPTETLPSFELADLSGKTWKLGELKGKVLVVDVWATWCHPCVAELPQVEKLYAKLKARADVQLLTFDIDSDLGLVAPFVKENGYSFPVLPATEFVNDLLPNIAIPQIWLVDAKGNWVWTQVGSSEGDAWVDELVKKLDAVKAGG